jgi:hypothetical protein
MDYVEGKCRGMGGGERERGRFANRNWILGPVPTYRVKHTYIEEKQTAKTTVYR